MSQVIWNRLDAEIPAKYDKYLGPFCFLPYAKDLVWRVRRARPGRLLELAAGTGVLTQLLDQELDSAWQITATDLNSDMLDQARARTYRHPVKFQIADACDIPFEDSSFEVVVCQFGLMFFPDKLRALQEIQRVLKPGGVLLFNVWDTLETCRAFLAAHEIAAQFFPNEPPKFLHKPFGFNDFQVLNHLLKSAGFKSVLTRFRKVGVAPTAEHVARGLFEGTPLATAIAERDPSLQEPMIKALTERLARDFGEAPCRSPLQAILCTAYKPTSGDVIKPNYRPQK